MKKDISEEDLINFLTSILNVEGKISLSDFKQRVLKSFKLSDHDLSPSPTRPGELIYEQKCRNLVSHKNFPHNMIAYENCTFIAR
ncbi:MAG: hypothetical protein J1F11_09845 [Oscillospiraceae bacterium]|nr:hypothetical protein [Oscillospiraceae bacterium]